MGATSAVTPFLYDPSGKPVEVELLKQGESLSTCSGRYFLYQPSTVGYGKTGEYRILLDDGHSPSVVSSFTKTETQASGDVALTAEIEISRSQFDPYEASSGMCDPISLEDRTIDGAFEYTGSLSRAAPIFVEIWYDDPLSGRVQQFDSTVPITRGATAAEVQSTVQVELPHIQASADCVELRLYTWTLWSVWRERTCLGPGEAQSFTVQFQTPDWDLRETAKDPSWKTRYSAPGCTIGSAAAPRQWGLPWCLLVLTSARLLRRIDQIRSKQRIGSDHDHGL